MDSVGHCTRYVNIKVFSEPYFSTYGQNPRTYTGKYVPEKTLIVLYFTKCDVFHWLSQKIVDIILKINNSKEVFS